MSEPVPTSPPPSTTPEKEPKGNIRIFLGKEYDVTDPKFAGLSKNAIKKILREELWQESKADRTKEKRAKHKRKRNERRQLVEDGVLDPLPKRPKSKYMTVGKVNVVLDCAFSDLMNEKEISSMRQQICRCYSANVRAEKESMPITITSFDDTLKKIMDEKAPSWTNWRNFEATSEPLETKFPNKEDLVYLSADSDNVAHDLEDGKTYIIGGIVDKNRHKNLCNDKAKELGIKTAQLPIGDYIRLASRKVLTVNQGKSIMIKWLDCRDWEKAFLEVIPERKLKKSTIIKNGVEVEVEVEESEEEEDFTEETDNA
ncbi:hypothetical protein HPULCUR_004176 [Helicostylum pulchrum]|uniref:tRNA (guanine(9)-N1)-methyltransferase n=1 Tax=Helicostylum pulchrum TaxID=562976 RepID=A0ABP9XWS0_9FUNG